MKQTSGKTALAALFAAALVVPAGLSADESFDDYKIGDTVRGDTVKKKDLEGRVVVIEYWGTR